MKEADKLNSAGWKFAAAALLAAAWAAAGGSAASGQLLAAEGAEEAPANRWVKIAEVQTGQRTGAVLLAVEEGRKLLTFGGDLQGDTPYMQAFDLTGRSWSEFSTAKPPAERGIHPYYQAAYDPKGRKLYCLSEGRLYTFDLDGGKWKAHGPVAALADTSWHALAIDPDGRKLVVIGADKSPDNLGWTRTAILDLETGKWSRLPLPEETTVADHRRLVAAWEATIDLIGRIRLTWYRDRQGTVADREVQRLSRQCMELAERPAMAPFVKGGAGRFERRFGGVVKLIAQGETLAALKAARAIQHPLEQFIEQRYPAPPARRNSPLAFDETNKVFVLFGGDHEDYLTNDTWVLDLARQSWRRAAPELAPSPRAGHALVALPGTGKLALYGGYVQSNDNWYGTRPWKALEPRQLWTYDVKADRWDLLAAWREKKGDQTVPPAAPGFYGYARQHYSPPALAAGASGWLILAAPGSGLGKSATWMLKPDPARPDSSRRMLAQPPNHRLYRTERFLARYCEVPEPPRDTALDALPANRWVKLPPAPRNVAYGCRQRDWGTAVWDGDNEQILLWGGGHCVRSASCPIHYSPVSGRMVEGYDADEPYSANGSGGYGSSVLNRPWVGPHAYNTYAYDPKAKLLVTASGFLYDPARMDWLRTGPTARPFQYIWSATVMEGTPRGAVVWARAADGERVSLWRFETGKGWTDLKPEGKLYLPYCDSEGMTYDARRDRLLLGWGGGYMKAGDGRLTTFDFKTGKLEKIMPAGAELGRIHNTREMVYVDHADWVVFAEPYVPPDKKPAKPYLRIYDCAKNGYFLLDAGGGPREPVHSQGWCYDTGRKLIYVITFRGDVYALRLDPASAKLLERPQPGP